MGREAVGGLGVDADVEAAKSTVGLEVLLHKAWMTM